MAHKKGQGSSRNGRDSQGQRRGVKRYAQEFVKGGSVLVRQVGTNIFPGFNVGMGRDFTLFAKTDGYVMYDRYGKGRIRVSVFPVRQPAAHREGSSALPAGTPTGSRAVTKDGEPPRA